MRGLLRDFADRGGTVLLSSHLLHEVEALVIIDTGRVVAQGTRAELLSGHRTLVRAEDARGLRAALAAADLTPAQPRRERSSSTPNRPRWAVRRSRVASL